MPAAVGAGNVDDAAGNATAAGDAAADGDGANEDQMWKALKLYIARDRQRKRKEYEAEVEEERQRKEKEARQRQDVMTLEETKEQIEQLEHKLKQLEKEKQQLFMQLKKVLNEDEVRKRQQAKENSEMQPMKMQMGTVPMPMFHPGGSGEPTASQARPPPLSAPLAKPPGPGGGPGPQTGVKRARSPSPSAYSHALYPHRLHHQPTLQHQAMYTNHPPPEHKMDEQRGLARLPARAVLWNKPTQYGGASGAAGGYYHLPTSSGVLYAPHHQHLLYPHKQIYLPDTKDPPPPQLLDSYRHPTHAAHASHAAAHAAHASHAPKPGSITQGYPVRPPPQAAVYPDRHRY